MAYIKEKDIEDLSYFRNRILTRMQDLNIPTLLSLAEKIVDTAIVTKIRPSGTIPLKASTIEKTIQKHLSDPCGVNSLPDTLSAKHVLAYAEVLECSVDYILGNTIAKSKDLCTIDLCNRTGLKEEAISTFLKMTDDRFAFRTLRISADESREILNSLLLSKEFAMFIHSLNEIADCWKPSEHTPLSDLEKEIGSERLKAAIKWDSKLDPLYEGPDPLEAELNDVFMFRKAIDQGYEKQESKNIQRHFYKYQLIKEFQNLVDELFPDD